MNKRTAITEPTRMHKNLATRHPFLGNVEPIELSPEDRAKRAEWAGEMGALVARAMRRGKPCRSSARLVASHAIASRPDATMLRALDTDLFHAALEVRS